MAFALAVAAAQSNADVAPPDTRVGSGCDAEAQLIAVHLATATYPDPTLCTRASVDLQEIRRREPHLTRIRYWARDNGTDILLRVTRQTFLQIQSGQYDGWSSLWRRWGKPTLRLNPLTASDMWLVVVHMPQIMRLDGVVTAYARLPGVLSAEPDYRMGDGPRVTVTRRGTSMHYVFDDASGDCLAGCISHHRYYYVSNGPGAISRIAEWQNSAPPPNVPPWVLHR